MLIREKKSADAAMQSWFYDVFGQQNQMTPLHLPNLKKSSERDFWSWASSYNFKADAWTGHKKIGDEWATVTIYLVDVASMRDAGFAVAHFFNRKENCVEYYEWAKCEHKFECTDSRNCFRAYTCEKCGAVYDVDSS